MGDPVETTSLKDVELVVMEVELVTIDVELVAMDELDPLFCL